MTTHDPETAAAWDDEFLTTLSRAGIKLESD
jgi:hypothetical protein